MKELKNFFNFKNNKIIITGCNGQLGSYLVNSFLNFGSIVIGIDISKKIYIKNKNFHFYDCDLNDEEKISSTFDKIFVKFDLIEGLINNAGVSIFENFELRTSIDLDKVIGVNLKGSFFCIQNFSRQKKNNITKSIINISSIYSIISPDPEIYKKGDRKNSEIYGATKAGLNQMTKYFAVHLANKNIRVNAISPGGIYNPKNPQSKKFIFRYSKKNPMKRMANVNEILGAVIYLLSPSSSYTNGHNIVIDGGMSCW
jgi:NAD(P)-dependent dehydrogenase (short-subunit alcohol dehydrogenase family)